MNSSERVETTSSVSLFYITSTSPQNRFPSLETVILTLNVQSFSSLFKVRHVRHHVLLVEE